AKNVLSLGMQKDLEVFDIVLLTETFLTEPFILRNFRHHQSLANRSPGPGRPSGGISCLSKLDCNASMLFKSQYVLVTQLKNPLVNVLACYMPPSLSTCDVLTSMLEALCNTKSSISTVIGGDFNCRIDSTYNSKTTSLVNGLLDMGFWLVSSPTPYTYLCHNGKSTIDIFFTNIVHGKVNFLGTV